MGVTSTKDLLVVGFLVAGVWVSIVPLTLVAVVAVLGACTIAMVAWSGDHLKAVLGTSTPVKDIQIHNDDLSPTQSSTAKGAAREDAKPTIVGDMVQPLAAVVAAVAAASTATVATVAASATAAAADAATAAADRTLELVGAPGPATPTTPSASTTASTASKPASAEDTGVSASASAATPAQIAAGPANVVAASPAEQGRTESVPAPAPTTKAAAAAPSAGAVCSPGTGSGVVAEPGAGASAQQGAAPAPAPAVGGGAILARFRAQKAATATAASNKATSKPPRVVFAYASQTGTAAEIAKNLYAEALERKLNAEALAFNNISVEALHPETTPVLVVIAASTGDGDPPDNASATYLALRRQQGGTYLKGTRFTVLGLGDSNYTRFMAVSRNIKSKLLDLGAELFYPAAEADEVDGLEGTIDPWTEGLWGPLTQALASAAAGGTGVGAGAGTGTGGGVGAAANGAATPTPTPTPAPAATAAPVANGTAEAPAAAAPPSTSAESRPSPVASRAPSAASGSAVGAEPGTMRGASASVDGVGSLELEYGLVQGRAPEGADLKGAPAPAPCRVRVMWEKDADAVAAVSSREAGRPQDDELQYRDPQGQYSHDRPFWSTITEARLESAPWSDRRVLHLQLDLRNSGIVYEAGDSLGVSPANPSELVQGLLQHLELEADSVFRVVAADDAQGDKAVLPHLPSPCTLGFAFTHCLDVTGAPKKSLLRVLAEHCSDEADKRTLTYYTAKAGREAYAHYIVANQPSLLDLLRSFPSCRPPLAVLLDALPPLVPRLYSVTTSGSVQPDSAEVALSVVRFPTRYGTRQGVATTWLDKITARLTAKEQQDGAGNAEQPIRVPLHFKRAADFKPPQDLSKPMIMIGPGTGVAPFRGFLQYRRAALQAAYPDGRALIGEGVGAAWLYFGCRHESEDFLYQRDLRSFEADGTLQRLRLAFSREGADKVYVQHRLREDAQDLASLIEAGAYVFVCGDGANMVKDVHAALLYVLVQGGGMSDDAATAKLAAMVQERRYVRDVWS